MAEAKQFAPTAARIKRAVRDGDLPNSRLAVAAAQLTIGLPFTFLLLDQIFQTLAAVSKTFVTPEDFTTNFMLVSYANGFSALLLFCLKSGCLIAGGGAVAAIATRGFRVSFGPLRPSWKIFDPGSGIRQLLGIQPGRGGASSVIVSIIGRIAQPVVVVALFILGFVLAAQTFLTFPVSDELSVFADTFISCNQRRCSGVGDFELSSLFNRILRPILVAVLITGIVDCAIARRKWRRGLMMDQTEMRDELRQQEGNPVVIGARRQLHREIALHDIIENVRNSDVVVVSGPE